MKKVMTFCLAVGSILYIAFQTETQAEVKPLKPEAALSNSDTTNTWVVQISPAPGVDSYATREISFGLADGPALTSSVVNKPDLIEIVPRTIPTISSQPTCPECNAPHRRAQHRMAYLYRYPVYRNTFPWLQNYAYFNPYASPAFYMYSDFIRSDWYGSPYRGNYFYYRGYRPSFGFGSLQARGFGAYDRMYNPRIIPFGYQYSGSRTYYANLALTAMYPSFP